MILEYPEIVTVSSNGEAAKEQPKSLEVFQMLENILRHGRPVWKQDENDEFLYFNGKEANP